MESRIKIVVQMLFEDIPYSDDVKKAQKDIEAALNCEYERLKKNCQKDSAFEALIKKYSRLSDMAVLAGYSEKDVVKWCSTGEVKGLKSLKKEIFHQRLRIYLISILAVCAASYLLSAAVINPFYMILFGIAGGASFLLYRRFKRFEQNLEFGKYDTEAYEYLLARSDIYMKRRLNGIALFFAVLFLFFFSELCLYVFGNSKSAEITENIFVNIIVLEIPMYICIKNRLCLGLIQRRINLPDKDKCRKQLISVTLLSVGYWILTTTVIVIFKSTLRYPGNTLLAAGFVFVLIILMYNMSIRKKITHRNIVINKRRIAVFAAAFLLCYGYMVLQRETWYTQPYINATPVVEHNEHEISYNDKTGVYTITAVSYQ
ncbi:MAG: hypothetical protein K2N34_04145 [Lachnospiraceae bacterium]|nr:hypothetical protein [Lachnospiraceae bacterium]